MLIKNIITITNYVVEEVLKEVTRCKIIKLGPTFSQSDHKIGCLAWITRSNRVPGYYLEAINCVRPQTFHLERRFVARSVHFPYGEICALVHAETRKEIVDIDE